MIIIHHMNNYQYRPRALSRVVEQALRDHPVVVLVGARQTGKTTLVQHLPSADRRVYLSLDDLDLLALAEQRPADFLARAGRSATIDEIQRVPALLHEIKREVDRSRRRGRFLLTGSANLLLMRTVSESLSGRAVYINLYPFVAAERRGEGTVPPWSDVLAVRRAAAVVDRLGAESTKRIDWRRVVLTGGMPPAALARSARERASWFGGYVQTYLERDLRELSQVSSIPDFRRLMRLAVHRVGQLLNQSELGRDAGMSQATTHRYINLLETTFQVHRVPAFAVNRSRRLIKSPKLYWTDTGLAAHLADIFDLATLRSSPLGGALLENLVLAGLRAWAGTVTRATQITYWRTAGGSEVDFVVEAGGRALPVEVKSGTRVRTAALRHIDMFLDEYSDRAPFGVVLFDTGEPVMLTRRIVGLPVGRFI